MGLFLETPITTAIGEWRMHPVLLAKSIGEFRDLVQTMPVTDKIDFGGVG